MIISTAELATKLGMMPFVYVDMFYNSVLKQLRYGKLSPIESERQQTLKAEGA